MTDIHPIMCPVIEQKTVSSPCPSHDKCHISPPSCRFKLTSGKPIKRKTRGQKKIKLSKKSLSSSSDTNNNIPRQLSEKLKKKKIVMHKAIGKCSEMSS
jgi:hypothetical protein